LKKGEGCEKKKNPAKSGRKKLGNPRTRGGPYLESSMRAEKKGHHLNWKKGCPRGHLDPLGKKGVRKGKTGEKVPPENLSLDEGVGVEQGKGDHSFAGAEKGVLHVIKNRLGMTHENCGYYTQRRVRDSA